MNGGGDLVLVGGGGHCVSCIDVIEADGRYRIAGILDAPEKAGQRVAGHAIIGADADIPRLAAEGCWFLVTLGQIKSASRRIELHAALSRAGGRIATVVAPSAIVARSAALGAGTIIMHHAVVVAGASIGENCIINTKALVEHEARIGSHCHISTGAIVNGGAVVGDRCFVGSGAVVSHAVEIAADCVLGAGAVVHRPVPSAGVYAGNPLRRLRT